MKKEIREFKKKKRNQAAEQHVEHTPICIKL